MPACQGTVCAAAQEKEYRVQTVNSTVSGVMEEAVMAHADNGGRVGPSRTLVVELSGDRLEWVRERVQTGKALSQAEVVSAALDMYRTAVEEGHAHAGVTSNSMPLEPDGDDDIVTCGSGWAELPQEVEEMVFEKVVNDATDCRSAMQVRLVCRYWASAAARPHAENALSVTRPGRRSDGGRPSGASGASIGT